MIRIVYRHSLSHFKGLAVFLLCACLGSGPHRRSGCALPRDRLANAMHVLSTPGREPWINLELVSGLRAGSHNGDGKVSQVPGEPVRSFAMFLRPRCDQARLWVQV